MNFKTRILRYFISFIFILIFVIGSFGESFAFSTINPIRLLVDNNDITAAAAPVIQNGRTLVPVRFVSEELNAQVDWNGQDRTVRITKGARSVLLRIDSHLIEYVDQDQDITYNLCDVAPQIINERTFVPLRLVSNALGAGIKWDESSRTVYVDSSKTIDITPFFDMKVLSVQPGQVITGPYDLQAAFPTGVPVGAAVIKYLLLDMGTARGVIIASGDQFTKAYHWVPDLRQNGSRILIAAVYDINGHFLAGDSIPVQVNVIPEVSMTGLVDGQVINDSVSLGAVMNFSAYYVKYTITNLDNGKAYISPELDPQGSYTWTPMMEDNGNLSIKATAYDQDDRAYESHAFKVMAVVARKLSLVGVSAGKTINGPVTLSVSRNFQVSGTQYVMTDPLTGTEVILAKVGYSSYKWFPGPALKGAVQLMVRVMDTKGETFSSGAISVNLAGTPRLVLEGVGPQQVVSGTVKLKVNSNVVLDSLKYILVNTKTGARRVIPGLQDPSAVFSYAPVTGDDGVWNIHAEGVYGPVGKITSAAIPITIYTGKIYSSVPVIAKSRFLEMASGMAIDSMQKTGMSAALQIAQAILETNWGQNVPVDKYNGQLSYNLFGIKGIGPAGYVISNTWEEYNGVSFRVDDKFRAYNSVGESWTDHKRLLLTASWYQIFRDAMSDSTQGAWALRRAGYATDSDYPQELMDIIKLYDLQKLDQIGI